MLKAIYAGKEIRPGTKVNIKNAQPYIMVGGRVRRAGAKYPPVTAKGHVFSITFEENHNDPNNFYWSASVLFELPIVNAEGQMGFAEKTISNRSTDIEILD